MKRVHLLRPDVRRTWCGLPLRDVGAWATNDPATSSCDPCARARSRARGEPLPPPSWLGLGCAGLVLLLGALLAIGALRAACSFAFGWR